MFGCGTNHWITGGLRPPLAMVLLALAGCWQAKAPSLEGSWGGEQVLARFEGKKCILYENGKLDIFAAEVRPSELLLSSWGQTMVWKMELKGDALSLHSPDGQQRLRFQKLNARPAELEIRPRKLVPPAPLPADRLQEIVKELARRKEIDQAVRLDPKRVPEQPKVDADNYAYLLALIQEVGWIDATRFGGEAAIAAFLIAQHSGDLALLLAVLPLVEADAKAKRIGLSYYASMADRVQAMQAERQRYGTQLGRNDKGEMVVLPLQDRAKVDEFRREVGLPPLAEYLEGLRQRHGWTIRFADK